MAHPLVFGLLKHQLLVHPRQRLCHVFQLLIAVPDVPLPLWVIWGCFGPISNILHTTQLSIQRPGLLIMFPTNIRLHTFCIFILGMQAIGNLQRLSTNFQPNQKPHTREVSTISLGEYYYRMSLHHSTTSSQAGQSSCCAPILCCLQLP